MTALIAGLLFGVQITIIAGLLFVNVDVLSEEVERRRVDIAIVTGSLFDIQIAIIADLLFNMMIRAAHCLTASFHNK